MGSATAIAAAKYKAKPVRRLAVRSRALCALLNAPQTDADRSSQAPSDLAKQPRASLIGCLHREACATPSWTARRMRRRRERMAVGRADRRGGTAALEARDPLHLLQGGRVWSCAPPAAGSWGACLSRCFAHWIRRRSVLLPSPLLLLTLFLPLPSAPPLLLRIACRRRRSLLLLLRPLPLLFLPPPLREMEKHDVQSADEACRARTG